MQNALAVFGISPQEERVYMTLLSAGPATLAALAKRVKLHRPTVQNALKQLEGRGVVRLQKKGKRTLFVGLSPVALRDDFARRSQEGGAALRELEHAFLRQTESMTMRTVEGKQALQQLFLDMVEGLPKGDVFYRFIAGSDRMDIEPYVHPRYRALRDEKQIQQLAITSVAMKGKPFKKGMGCLWKVIPAAEDPFEYGMAELIYGSTVAFIDYVTETAVIIESVRFAKYQKAIHRALYARLSDRVV